MQKLGVTIALGLSAGALILSGSAAYAGTARAVPATHAAPAGYQIMESAGITVPPGEQKAGSVACPGAQVPLSGGVTAASSSLFLSVNSSYPSGQSWNLAVNNETGLYTNVFVYAVCADPPAGYKVAKHSVKDTSGSQTPVSAGCPAGTFVDGGGNLSKFTTGNPNGIRTDLTLNYSRPNNNGWTALENNTSTKDAVETVFAVCSSKLAGYQKVVGVVRTNPAGAQTEASATCPAPTVVIGAGGTASSDASTVTVNSSFPTLDSNGKSTVWDLYQNNASADNETISVHAICAGT